MITSTKVSIIIPCYNYDKYLVEVVNSILLQKVNPEVILETIIVDDCSTDKSLLIAQEIAKRFESVKVIHNEVNKKLPATRNIGIKSSNGRYIVCLDADDKVPHNYIQANFNNLSSRNLDISYTDLQCFGDSNKTFAWPEFDLMKLRKSNYIHSSSMFKRTVWEQVGGFDERFILGSEDYDFWLMAVKKGFKIGKCNDTLLWYRRTEQSMIETITSKNREIVRAQLKKKHGNFYFGG